MATSNHCQLFPSNTEAAGIHPTSKTAYCVLPPHQREIPVTMHYTEWFARECVECEHYKLSQTRESHEDLEDFLDDNPDACLGFAEIYYRGKGACNKGIAPQKTLGVNVEVSRSLWLLQTQTYVFHVDNQRNIISALAAPNVYERGQICWGRNSPPRKLNVAVNRFFGSPFNSDLYFSSGDSKPERLQNTFKSYRSPSREVRSNNYLELKSYKAFNTTLSYDAAIVVANLKTLELLPSHCKTTEYSETPRAIGWAVFSREENCYFIRFKDLSDNPHSGHDCIAKKKRMSGSSKLYILGNAYEHGYLVNDILDAKDKGLNQEVPEEEAGED